MKSDKFLLGVVLGAVVGGITVALSTPKTGEKLREDIKKESEILYNEGRKVTHDLNLSTHEQLSHAKVKASGIYEDSKAVIYETTNDATTKIQETTSKIGNKIDGFKESIDTNTLKKKLKSKKVLNDLSEEEEK